MFSFFIFFILTLLLTQLMENQTTFSEVGEYRACRALKQDAADAVGVLLFAVFFFYFILFYFILYSFIPS